MSEFQFYFPGNIIVPVFFQAESLGDALEKFATSYFAKPFKSFRELWDLCCVQRIEDVKAANSIVQVIVTDSGGHLLTAFTLRMDKLLDRDPMPEGWNP